MTEIQLRFDWVDPEGVQGAELRATWAQLGVWIGDEPVTRVFDEKSRTVRDHVYVPLYPLAEWLATHWWLLFYEVETPARSADNCFEMRHSLRDAREGYALPALSIHSQGETVQLAWVEDKLPPQRLEFLSRGQKTIGCSALRRELGDFIEAVVLRLQQLGVEQTVLEEEWAAISSTDSEEKEFCTAAAALGLDPYDLDDPQREMILAVGENIPASLRSEFFSVARAEQLAEGSQVVLDAVELGRSNPADLLPLKELRVELSSYTVATSPRAPWRDGYDIARRVRDHLNLDGRPLPSFQAISQALQVGETELGRAIRPAPTPTRIFDAVMGVNEWDSPGFVVSSPLKEEAQRFHLCRGLFEFLTSPALQPALVTRSRSDRQSRSRAFAAEFLAPADGLRARVSGSTVGNDEVDELAREFGVQPWVVAHQIENHRIGSLAPL